METGWGFAVGLAVQQRPAGESSAPPMPSGWRRARLAEAVAVSSFTDIEVDEALRDVQLMRARLAAYEAALVERKELLRPQQVLLPGGRMVGELGVDPAVDAADDWLPDELSLVLGVGRGTASHLLERSLVLTRQLPATWAALADGLIDQARARVIVDVLRHQKASFGGPVADGVLEHVEALALGWALAGVLPTPLRERVAGALLAADEAAADRRRKLRRQRADVTVTPTGDGMADLLIRELPAEDAAAVNARVDAYARQWQADGDTRPIGQLRSETARDMLLHPWDEKWGQPPVGAQVSIRVDLEDLENTTQPTTTAQTEDAPTGIRASTDEVTADLVTDAAAAGVGRVGDRLPGTAPPAKTPPQSGPLDDQPLGGAAGGRSPTVGRLAISPRAVEALLVWLDVLDLHAPAGGSLLLEICAGGTGALLAAVTPHELRAAARNGLGFGRPPARAGYTPSAAQRRFVQARDRSCRFPGCRRPARFCDADHVCAYDCGGATDCPNLCCLCRRHHRLKTHAPGWAFRMDPDGVLHVTTPTGITRTTRPPAMAEPVPNEVDEPPPF